MEGVLQGLHVGWNKNHMEHEKKASLIIGSSSLIVTIIAANVGALDILRDNIWFRWIFIAITIYILYLITKIFISAKNSEGTTKIYKRFNTCCVVVAVLFIVLAVVGNAKTTLTQVDITSLGIGRITPSAIPTPTPIPTIYDPSGKIAAGDKFSLLLRSDKTVSTYGTAEEIDTSNWENIIQIAAYQNHAIGLCESGRVVVSAVDRDEYDVGDWSGITQVAACKDGVIGVTKDGCVLLEGPCRNRLLECTRWENVDRIIAAGEQIIARKYDGTLITARKDNDVKQLNAKHDSDIISVAVAEDLIFLVHEDGIVKIVGDAQGTVASIADWSSISEIALGETFVVGRRWDGTAQKLGNPEDTVLDVKSWSEIIAVCAGENHTIGLRKDGTVLATGLGTSGQCGIHGESYWVGN